MTTPAEHPLHVLPLTCDQDDREHLVEDADFLHGRRTGHAAALCGHQVHIGSARAPVGRRCHACETYRQARESLPSLPHRLGTPRRHKASWLARLRGAT